MPTSHPVAETQRRRILLSAITVLGGLALAVWALIRLSDGLEAGDVVQLVITLGVVVIGAINLGSSLKGERKRA